MSSLQGASRYNITEGDMMHWVLLFSKMYGRVKGQNLNIHGNVLYRNESAATTCQNLKCTRLFVSVNRLGVHVVFHQGFL